MSEPSGDWLRGLCEQKRTEGTEKNRSAFSDFTVDSREVDTRKD